MTKRLLLLGTALALLLTAVGCGGQKGPTPILPPQATETETARLTEAAFPYDPALWELDDSTQPAVFRCLAAPEEGRTANFTFAVGDPYTSLLNETMLEAFADACRQSSSFLTVDLAELRMLEGSPAMYLETTVTYTDEAIDRALADGLLTQEALDAAGGREAFLDIPPIRQLMVCPTAEKFLCVFTGTYFDQQQKEAILDAIALAMTEIDIL